MTIIDSTAAAAIDHSRKLAEEAKETEAAPIPPVVKAHGVEYEAILSETSVALLRDPRAMRLLVELGYYDISTADCRQELPPAGTPIVQFASKTASGVYWHASKHTCTCRGYRPGRPCVHVKQMQAPVTIDTAPGGDDEYPEDR